MTPVEIECYRCGRIFELESSNDDDIVDICDECRPI